MTIPITIHEDGLHEFGGYEIYCKKGDLIELRSDGIYHNSVRVVEFELFKK